MECIIAIPENTASKANFLTYYDPKYGVKIQYPSNWTVDERETLSYDGVTKIVGFIKDPNALAGDFLISVHNLTNKYLSRTIGLEELLDHTIDYYKEYYHDFNLIESNTSGTLVNTSNSAYKLVWIDKEGQYSIKTMQMGTITGNLAYIIRYYAELGEYSDNLPLIKRMIDSLRISNNTAQHHSTIADACLTIVNLDLMPQNNSRFSQAARGNL
jgi:eukaryotic-like serine/threonine-protein kinase